jgi:hypothetical protein
MMFDPGLTSFEISGDVGGHEKNVHVPKLADRRHCEPL